MKIKDFDLTKGFTLVEILVTLLISLLLISGMISVLLTSKQSYLQKDSINQIQENLRISSDTLRKIISMAESIEASSTDKEIVVRYSGGQQVFNCLGQPVNSSTVVSYLFIKKNVLYCSVTYPATAGSQQPLVEGIASMTIQYGVDSNGDGQVDHYMNPLTQSTDWKKVISARILLRLVDPTAQRQPEALLTVAMRPRIFARLQGDF